MGWTFGGGTRLALLHGHRVSYDVDVFLDDPQAVAFLSPRVNDDAAAAATEGYSEGAAHLKLVTREGEVDFVVAPRLTEPGWTAERIAGRDLRAETAAEVLAKKMLYRGADFTHRDAYDLAALLRADPAAVRTASEAAGPLALRRLAHRLGLLLPGLAAELPDYVNPAPGWEGFAAEVPALIEGWLASGPV